MHIVLVPFRWVKLNCARTWCRLGFHNCLQISGHWYIFGFVDIFKCFLNLNLNVNKLGRFKTGDAIFSGLVAEGWMTW